MAELEKVNNLKIVYKLYLEAKKKWSTIGEIPRSELTSLKERYTTLCAIIETKCEPYLITVKEEATKSYQIREELIENLTKIVANIEHILQSSTQIAELSLDKWSELNGQYKDILAKWKELPVVPKEKVAINETFKNILKKYHELSQIIHQKNQAKMEIFLAEKKELLNQLQILASEHDSKKTPWQTLKPRVKDIEQKWQKVGKIWRSIDKENIISQYENTLQKLLANHQEDATSNLAKKRQLLQQLNIILEEVQHDNSVETALTKIIKLQKDWKKIDRAPGENDRKLWKEFHEKCNSFFKDHQEKIDLLYGNLTENITKKKELLVELEQIIARIKNKKSNQKELFQTYKSIQERWHEIKIYPSIGGQKNYLLEKDFRNKSDEFFRYRNQALAEYELAIQDRINQKKNLVIQLEYLLNVQNEHSNQKIDLATRLKEALKLNQKVNEKPLTLQQKIKRIEEQWRLSKRGYSDEERQLEQTYRQLLDNYYQKIKSKKKPLEKN